MQNTNPAPSPWSPLRKSVFRTIWLASIVSNVGTLMQSVGVGWLLTSLTASPLLVALMQTATSLPIFLLGLPAGALADLVDRRKLLLAIETSLMALALALGLATLWGYVNTTLLLSLMFLMGMGAAMDLPIWAAIVPDLVEKDELHAAVSLNATGFNIARAVGPALGGVVVAMAGPAAVFFLNSLSFLAVIAAVYFWKAERPRRGEGPSEDMLGAIASGLRYSIHSQAMRAVLVRTGIFVFGASAVWALMPSVARLDLGLEARWYGVIIGSLGVGAVASAPFLPAWRKAIDVEHFASIGTVLFAGTAAAMGLLRSAQLLPLLVAFLLLGGVAWLGMMSTLSTAAANAAPAWVRARAMGIHLLTFAGSMTAGSYLWGALAQRFGTQVALLAAAGLLLLGMLAFRRWSLRIFEGLDLEPSGHWREPNVALQPAHGDGPVMVTVTYQVPPANAAGFLQAMQAMRTFRFREGALRWDLYRDMDQTDTYVESFTVSTWGEHLRQHTRVTRQDQAIEQRAFAFVAEGTQPVSRHLIAPQASTAALPAQDEALREELQLL